MKKIEEKIGYWRSSEAINLWDVLILTIIMFGGAIYNSNIIFFSKSVSVFWWRENIVLEFFYSLCSFVFLSTPIRDGCRHWDIRWLWELSTI